MVLPNCFVNIPALPNIVSLSGIPVGAILAYAPTHTNYFGGTSCWLNSYVTPTPSTLYQALSTAKCTLPASVSGKAYSVTPVIYVPRTVSSTLRHTIYSCDPIPATSINKGNFQFACKSLQGKDMGTGYHTVNWYLPTAAGISIKPYSFFVRPPSSTPKYVINTALASTTLVPTTLVRVDATTSSTRTLVSTSTVRIPTGTSTCLVTVTVAPVPGRRLRRDSDADLGPDSEFLRPDIVIADADPEYNLAHEDGDHNSDDMVMDLNERAAAIPTIGKPDFTYPPYGVTTIYVRSISTSIWTNLRVYNFYETPPPVTTTVSYEGYTLSTVTVTSTPIPG